MYAGFHATGVLQGVLNDEIRSKLAKNRLIFKDVFALGPRGARAPFAPPGYASDLNITHVGKNTRFKGVFINTLVGGLGN